MYMTPTINNATLAIYHLVRSTDRHVGRSGCHIGVDVIKGDERSTIYGCDVITEDERRSLYGTSCSTSRDIQ